MKKQLYQLVKGGGGSDPVLIEKTVVVNGEYNAEDDSADGYSKVTVNTPVAVLIEKTVLANGEYEAEDDNADGYSKVTVNMPQVNKLPAVVDGSATVIAAEDIGGATGIRKYIFYQYTGLTSVTIPDSVTSIGDYALYGCTGLASLTIPNTVTYIGSNAFNSAGATGSTFDLEVDGPCTVMSSAFSYSKIRSVKGEFAAIESSAFSSCNFLTTVDISVEGDVGNNAFNALAALTKLHIKIKGSVGQYGFYQLYNASDIDFSGSVLMSVGNYAFYGLASRRSNPENNIITLDFSDSLFGVISQYAFAADYSYKTKYMIYKFPETLTSIQANAFANNDHCEYYFTGNTPPTLSVTTAWQGATNYNIFVPYSAINAYRTATNWVAQSSYMKGYAPANTFELGDTLPAIGVEGYELTWYSDKACTVAVTTVSDPTAEYYCIAGTTQVGYGIRTVATANCDVIITDGLNTYKQGDGVLAGTTLTITADPTVSGYTPYLFTVNGQDITSGYTVQMTEDLTIAAAYWDETTIPSVPNFALNTWAMIASGFRNGIAADLWNVGETKSVTLTNDETYTVRIADMKPERYEYTDETGYTNGVLEFVQLQSTYKAINTNGGAGSWANCYMKNTVMPEIYNMLPADLKTVLKQVKVLSGDGGTVNVTSSDNYLFLAAECELVANPTRSIGIEESPKGQFDLYRAFVDSQRIKRKLDNTAYAWWLRSPYAGRSMYVLIGSSGNISESSTSWAGGVAIFFAI